MTYRARPALAEQNQMLVEAVFDQLHAAAPNGITYTCVRLDDDTFVHIAGLANDDNPLLLLDAFGVFSSTVADRCEPGHEPQARRGRLVGDYRPSS